MRTPKPEKPLKGCHWILSAVMPKDEFIQVNLKVTPAYAMVRSHKPLLKIPDGAIGQWDNGFCAPTQISPQGLGSRHMIKPYFGEFYKTRQTVRVYGGSGGDISNGKVVHRWAGEIVHDLHP